MALIVGPFVENGRTYRMLSSSVICGLALVVHTVYTLYLSQTWIIPWCFLAGVALTSALYIGRGKSPINFLVLAGFVIVQAHTVGVILSVHPREVVFRAVLLALAALAGSSIYANLTKRIISPINSLILLGFSMLLLGGLSQTFTRSKKFDIAVSSGGALIFSVLGIVDTQKSFKTSSPEEYIFSTIHHYIDTINLLAFILRILHVALQ